MFFNIKNFGLKIILTVSVIFYFTACKKVLEVKMDNSKLTSDQVFNEPATALSALSGVYLKLADYSSFASGSDVSITGIAGLSADEFVDYYQADAAKLQFEQNNILSDNNLNYGLWKTLYETIYKCNVIVEKLGNSTAISTEVKDQLSGEALFLRAFSYFYLVNLYGDVPLATSSSVEINSRLGRAASTDIYEQIETDLTEAQNKLAEEYQGTVVGERVRVNKSTATALLARVFLYQEKWEDAEGQATLLIDNPSYQLEELDKAFLKESREAIWQIKPTSSFVVNGWDGYYFAVSFIGPQSYVLNALLPVAFEPGDQRRNQWIGTDGAIFWPFKYKADLFVYDQLEFSIVFRLAEQYLIRAEARAHLNNFTGANSAASDLNSIRARAGLDDTPANDLTGFMQAIEQERRVELFTEWGHRWFDVKRWGRSTTVLSPVKTDWSDNDILYPLPKQDMDKNPSLKPQNAGY